MQLNRILFAVGLQYILALAVYGKVIDVTNPGDGNNIHNSLQQAINSAVDGDILLLPKGNFSFLGEIIISKRISLIGQGADENGTVLYRPESISDDELDNQSMISFRLEDDNPSNMLVAKIWFKGKDPSITAGDGGSLAADWGIAFTNCVDFIVTECRFEHFGFGGLFVQHKDYLARGLIFKNSFIHNAKGPDALELGYGVCVFGNNENWVEDPKFGSDNFIFIEDNYFEEHRHSVAGGGAGLYVFRNNYVLNNLWGHAIDAHEAQGEGKGNNTYSTRAIEAYNNSLINTKFNDFEEIIPDQDLNRLVGWAVIMRGGEGLIYENSIKGYLHAIGLTTYVQDFPETYPIPYQIGYQSALQYGSDQSGYSGDYGKGDVFIWENDYVPYDNSDYCTLLSCSKVQYIQEKRDYHYAPKPLYNSYQYPHPNKQIALDKFLSIGFQNSDSEIISNNPPLTKDQDFTLVTGTNNNLVGTFWATDSDIDQLLSYKIVEGNNNDIFYIDQNEGDIFYTEINQTQSDVSMEFNLVIEVKDNSEDSKIALGNAHINIAGRQSIYYIDPDNTNDPVKDGTIDHPYNSWEDVDWKEGGYYLQKAGSKAFEDKIIIGADYITLGSYGEGTQPEIISETNTFVIRGFETHNITIKNLTLVAPNAVAGIYFLGSACDSIIVDHCTFKGSACGVRIIDGKAFKVQYSTFENCQNGISSYSQDNEIYYNIFNNNQIAVELANTLSNSKVYNNVYYGNIKGVQSSSQLSLYNNIFYFEGTDEQALVHENSNVNSDYNIFYPEQEGFVEIANTRYSDLGKLQSSKQIDLNSILTDPEFEDILHFDFSIKPGSPAVDKGKNVGISNDYKGYKVPSGGITDIGIDEIEEDQKTGLTEAQSTFTGNNLFQDMIVYPNPAQGMLSIQLTEKYEKNDESCELQVNDLSGRCAYHQTIDDILEQGVYSLNLNSLPKGTYLLILRKGSSVTTKKIILN